MEGEVENRKKGEVSRLWGAARGELKIDSHTQSNTSTIRRLLMLIERCTAEPLGIFFSPITSFYYLVILRLSHTGLINCLQSSNSKTYRCVLSGPVVSSLHLKVSGSNCNCFLPVCLPVCVCLCIILPGKEKQLFMLDRRWKMDRSELLI